MTFEARDLMIDLFPAQEPVGPIACGEVSAPPPAPQPCRPPSCKGLSWNARNQSSDLPDLRILRELLRRALRS
jgi:hypothetical protein